jgi:hypothetical protein
MIISADDAIRELSGTTCRGCDGAKARRMSHCRRCYMELPKDLRRQLYNRVGSGYEEAYTESVKILRERHGLSTAAV